MMMTEKLINEINRIDENIKFNFAVLISGENGKVKTRILTGLLSDFISIWKNHIEKQINIIKRREEIEIEDINSRTIFLFEFFNTDKSFVFVFPMENTNQLEDMMGMTYHEIMNSIR
jgi:hypothetical protein